MSLSIKIAITPKASGQPSYEILDLIVVTGRAYLSLKDENTSAVTNTTAWTQITENTYDIAVRLGYVGTESQWLASLSKASEDAAVIANSAASAANTAAGLANTATTNANSAAVAANTAAANITSTVPWSLYRSRVLADSGVISDIEKLTKLYIENLKLLDNTVFLWDGSAGIKTRTSGANTYATKLYDMSAGNRDAAQATEANQPFVVGGIAPSERIRLKNNSLVKALSHSTINISSVGTNGFSITTVLKPTFNKLGTAANQGRYVMGSVELYFNNTGALILYSAGTGSLSVGNNLTNLLRRGSSIVTWVADAYGLRCYVNGVQYAITGTYTPFSGTITGMLNTGSDAAFDGEIYHHQIFNKALSASEVQAQHAYLRLQHPEIEGINIGNQHWATSNYEGVVTGNGTVIPEVQDNAAWAALTTPAWCYYNNDPLNGVVYGKNYNLYGARAINSNSPTGYTIGTYAQWLQMVTLLGGISVAGNKMKLNGTALWAIGNVGTNESGFTSLPNGQRNADGTFSQINNKANFWTSDGYLVTLDYNAATVTFTSGADAKIGAAVRLLRTSPAGDNERTINTGYITNALGATNLDISIPFGYQVESIRIDSETIITGLSAKLYTGGLSELETLFTAKSVTANVQKVIAADADQSIQQTDAVVRVNGTKANTAARFRVWVKLTKVVFS